MDVEISDMPDLRVGTVHHVGPYNQIPQAFGRLNAIATAAGLFRHPGAAMISIYSDDPETTPHDQLRSDAAITVPADVALPHGLGEGRLPGGRHARHARGPIRDARRHLGPIPGRVAAGEREPHRFRGNVRDLSKRSDEGRKQRARD